MLVKNRKVLLITTIAAVTAIVLGVAGWVTYSSIQLNEARTAYEAAITDLDAAQEAATGLEDSLATALDTHTADLEVAEQLVALLGEGTESLLVAADGTRTAREDADGYVTPGAPAKSAGRLPENPGVDDYIALRADVEALTARWLSYADDLRDDADGITADNDALAALWQAQVDTAANTAAAGINANPNASQEAKDSATAAADALTALTNPLAAESVALWQALLDANSTLATQEQAFQQQKAAEEEAARRAAANRAPSRGGSPSGGGSSGGGYTPVTLEDVEAVLARDLGIDPSLVNCFDIPRGIRCEYPGGWREVTF